MDPLLLAYLLCGLVYSCTGSVLLLGGEVTSSLLNQYLAKVDGYGSCGYFNPGIPDLPHNNMQFGSAIIGSTIVVCGGYGRLGVTKNCYSLDLDSEPLTWTEFPSLIHGKHSPGMVTVGEDLFVVGGDRNIGVDRTIERYSWSAGVWEEVADLSDLARNDFCTLPWGSDGIVLVGGHSTRGYQEMRRTDVFNTTDLTWSRIADLDLGRYRHACTWFNGSIIAAGGYNAQSPYIYDELSSVEMYSIKENAWNTLPEMQNRRSTFSLTALSEQLAALGGYYWTNDKQVFMDTVEVLEDGEQQGWQYAPALQQGMSGFGLVDVGDRFADIECQS